MPFIYWAALIISSFTVFQFLGISFSANPSLYVVEIKNSGVAERVREISRELENIKKNLNNVNDLSLNEINTVGDRMESVTRSMADQISEMLHLILDAERKSSDAKKQAEAANADLKTALLEKNQQIALYKEEVESLRSISARAEKYIAKAVTSDAKEEISKEKFPSFVTGIIGNLVSAAIGALLVMLFEYIKRRKSNAVGKIYRESPGKKRKRRNF